MNGKILITDSLFIFDEHEKKFRDAGFEIERLDKPAASEEELIKAVKGKVGYLLGGIEHVTENVIEAADKLKAISFCGIGWTSFIPGWKLATKKGIAISNTPDGPTNEVSEWAVTAALTMNRHFLKLGRANKDTEFMVTQGLEAQSVGIIGLGRTGSRIAELIKPFKPSIIRYYSLHRHEDKERSLGVVYTELAELLEDSDIVFVCVGGDPKDLLDEKQFKAMKKDALIVSYMHPGVLNADALYTALKSESIRAVSDYPMDSRFDKLSLDRWYCMNSSNTVTQAGSKLMSDTATNSLLNLLKMGQDKYRVN